MRAANGTTMAFQLSSSHSGNGILGGGGYGIPHTKLSKERKHRMREMATQKLSCAYHLDEIAASVATMQSASSLEEVAKLVLQRNTTDPDATYVNFFHEKIPSRMLDESTSLEPLNNVIQDRPMDVPLLRTRAVTKIFKNDLTGAVADLTKALALSRFTAPQHKAGQVQVEGENTFSAVQERSGGSRAQRSELILDDGSQPSSLITQLLFQRAGVYFTLACQNATSYLAACDNQESSRTGPNPVSLDFSEHIDQQFEPTRLLDTEARKLARSYAKRALRDYISFLAFFDYTPGVISGAAAQCDNHLHVGISGPGQSATNTCDSPPRTAQNSMSDDDALHDRFVQFGLENSTAPKGYTATESSPSSPPRKVYPISVLFAASTPAELPQYPAAKGPRVKSVAHSGIYGNIPLALEHDEAITYHPLLIEALHTLLLCHCIVQTPQKEHLRHAHMVARLTRVCDGYPIFLAARSPSRSDWTEVIRRTDNWLGLALSWESLCTPVSVMNEAGHVSKKQGQTQSREHRRREAIMESIADERVHDEATFQAAIASRERRAEVLKDDIAERSTGVLKSWVQKDSKDCSIGTERAFIIARWINEAPFSIPSSGKSKLSQKEGKVR